jgi:hypothetical protein
MNPSRQALVNALLANPQLTAMLSNASAVYHREAPRTAHTPYVVFDKNSGADEVQFAGGRIIREGWLVKAVDFGTSATVAEDIAKEIDDALHGQTFTLSNGLKASVLRDTHVDYAERDGDQVYQHVGAVYRFIDP